MKKRISILSFSMMLFLALSGVSSLSAEKTDMVVEGKYGAKVCDAGWFEAYLEFDTSPYYLCNGASLGKTSGGFRYQTIGDDHLLADALMTDTDYRYVSAWTKNGAGEIDSSEIEYDSAINTNFAKPGLDYYSMNSYATE
ncbi:MAG: hypothetical protein ACRC5M_00875 [Anaeroplasmataceae bacterium]